MQSRVLVKNSGDYVGKYVAVASFNNNQVVSSGNSPKEVLQEAKDMGYQHAVLIHVPPKDTIHIY